MSIPASLTPITVTARYVKADGSPAAGSVRFQLSAAAAAPVDKAMVPAASVKATLDASGAISVVLAASDDPDWAQDGLTYQVTERITGAELRTYNINLPATAPGGTVDLASLAPAVPGPPLVSYVLAAAVGAPTGVASLDVNGQVPLSQLGNAPAGGGGGTPAGTVVAETAFGQAASAGVANTQSRGDHTHGTPAAPTAASVGADPAGTATTQVTAHTGAVDPHGDRAYANGIVNALDQVTATALNGKVPTTRQVTAGTGLTGGGDLSADRSLAVAYGVATGTAAQGNDTRIVGAVQASLVDAKGDLLVATAPDTVARLPVGSNGQVLTADSTDASGVKWVTPAVPYTVLAFSQAGVVTATPGAARVYNDSGRTLTIRAVRASAGTAPTGAALIVDVNRNGVTIFTTQGNRPTVTAGANTSGKVTAIDVTTLADGDYLTVDVDQIGSTVAGSNLTVQIWAA